MLRCTVTVVMLSWALKMRGKLIAGAAVVLGFASGAWASGVAFDQVDLPAIETR
jgi:hypothetical protein